MCGKAIHLPRLNDERVRNREKKLCIFRGKIDVFGQFYGIIDVLGADRKLCNKKCLRDNANVIT